MTDQMMRIAGRGQDGKAKAIKTDNLGRLETSEYTKRQLFDFSKEVPYGETYESDLLKNDKFLFGKLVLYFNRKREMEITLVEVVGSYEIERVIFDDSADSHVSIDFKINTQEYYYRIRPKSEAGLYIRAGSFELLTDEQIPVGERGITSRPILQGNTVLEKNETFTSGTLESERHLYGNLTLRFSGNRKVKIDIVDLDDNPSSDLRYSRNIYTGTGEHSISVGYEIKSERYCFVITAQSDSGLYIHRTSFETLMTESLPLSLKKEVISQSPNGSPATVDITRPKKYPEESLVFKESPIEITTLTKGTDGNFYIIDKDGQVKKYDTIVSEGDPLEEGIVWNRQEMGEVVYLFVADDGVVYFSNIGSGDESIARIYRGDTISDTPELVHESDNNISQRWTRRFGVDRYFNGTSYFLAGTYYIAGREQRREPRELVLSTDGGRTFEVVKYTSNIDDSDKYNSHWHDVEIDYHHGLLWASEGDGPINHHVHYSEDMGKTWNIIADDMQPTSITAFPNKIIFGRDYGIVGVDGLEYPDSVEVLEGNLIHPIKEMKSQRSVYYFAMKAVRYKNEAYMGFFLHVDGEAPMIIATGDFGESWHGVWIGSKQQEMYRIIEIDDKYIYAYEKRHDNNKVLYAEKPNWT